MAKKKQRRCRICKTSPVWRGGDVKDPGPFCKKCYHKRVWPQRRASKRATDEDRELEEEWISAHLQAQDLGQPFYHPDDLGLVSGFGLPTHDVGDPFFHPDDLGLNPWTGEPSSGAGWYWCDASD
jgi:hypothetical protein